MASIEHLSISDGFIGLHGDIVFRRRGNKIFTYPKPKFDPNRKFSEKQLAKQELFKSANIYAKTAITDPKIKAMYQAAAKPGRTAYNVAFKDYCNPPEVEKINLDNYKGNNGDIIHIRVYDIFKVASVHVAVFNTAGELIEQGNAIEDGKLGNFDWNYTTISAHGNPQGFTIKISASDIPGNITTKEFVI